MDKTVNVFGCSHTYGTGLDDCGLTEPWKDNSTTSWPYYIFDQEQIANYSFNGCSNDTIALRLIRHTTKENIVIIMFTYPERMHYIRDGYNFVISPTYCDAISENGNENWVGKQLAEKHSEKNKRFIIDNFDDNFIEINFLKNILLCQYFCVSNQIEYYFTMVNKREKTVMRQSLEQYRDSLYNSINWSKIFLVENKYGYCDYAKTINAEYGNDNAHYGADYHKLFGNLFLDWINLKKKV